MALDQVLALNQELSFLIKEPSISFVTKYHLVKLFEETKEIIKPFNEVKFEIFKKYGKEDPKTRGVYSLKEASSENFEKGQKEIDELVKEEIVFKDHNFKMKDFENIKSDVAYVQIFKFIEL